MPKLQGQGNVMAISPDAGDSTESCKGIRLPNGFGMMDYENTTVQELVFQQFFHHCQHLDHISVKTMPFLSRTLDRCRTIYCDCTYFLIIKMVKGPITVQYTLA